MEIERSIGQLHQRKIGGIVDVDQDAPCGFARAMVTGRHVKLNWFVNRFSIKGVRAPKQVTLTGGRVNNCGRCSVRRHADDGVNCRFHSASLWRGRSGLLSCVTR